MKLLQGQQLYISKHMHGQLLHADKDDHTDPRPLTNLPPCLTAITCGDIILNAWNMSIYQRDPHHWFHYSKKLPYGSFLFQNLPTYIGDGQIYTSTDSGLETMETHIYSTQQLAQIHWARIYEHLLLDLYHDFGHVFIAEGAFHPGAPGVTYQRDLYTAAFDSDTGPFGASVQVLFQHDCTRQHQLLTYYCPLRTVMEVRQHIPGVPTIFTIHRDENGDYHLY